MKAPVRLLACGCAAAVLFLYACALPLPRHDSAQALLEAAAAGFTGETVRAGRFRLLVLRRGDLRAATVHVYIEGDGRAFRTRWRPSADPTPRQPVALRLAVRDPAPAVLYLARPCQFLPEAEGCEPRYWTTARYSEPVIAAMDEALERLLPSRPGRALGFIGYSGGGAVAALLAARRSDAAWLVTVAGNLDHRTWTAWHGVTPLAQSLNPPDYAERLRVLPQLHLRGGRDDIVPAAVTEAYLSRLGHPATARVETLPRFGHECCWTEVWPAVLGRLPPP